MFTATVALALALTPAETGDGWTKLFNGKDLAGWKLPESPAGFKAVAKRTGPSGAVVALVGTRDNGDEEVMWQVKDGLLVGGGHMSHLYTEADDYEDFHLKVVVKVNDKGNSGIFFRAGLRPGVPLGYEAQVNATHGDRVKSGSLYPNGEFGLNKLGNKYLVMDTAAHGPDEFFTEEVICQGPRVRILVNGNQTVDFTDPYDHPKRKGAFRKGHIAVQAHDPGSVMTFKSVEVKRLSK